MAGPAANGGMDYLATTIGTTMMHLNQALAPQGGGGKDYQAMKQPCTQAKGSTRTRLQS